MSEFLRSRPACAGVGIVAGLVIGLNIQGLWPSVPLHASATHGLERFAIATGLVDERVEALYFLDYLTGDLRAAVINPKTGKRETGDVRSETKRTFENLRAIIQTAGSSLDDVIKSNIYLLDIYDFAAMNEVYQTYFAAPFPARTTIQAGALPGGIAVEIECIAKKAR